MKVCCIVVAAGKGSRTGLGYNKAYYPLAGKSVLGRTLRALSACTEITGILPVISTDDEELYSTVLLQEGPFEKLEQHVFGGKTRRESVYKGLKALPRDTDIVLIHDAARPFVTNDIVRTVIDRAQKCGSGVISSPVSDTLKRIDESGNAVETLDRSRIMAVQTPQAFSYIQIMKAHEEAPEDYPATDDASLYERCFGKTCLVTAPEAKLNIKLTTMEDFRLAEERLMPALRTGTGYDVHKLASGRKLILCGVEIPHETGLLGHSDADVALHALMDAMLGAAALGDIGRHFPDSDKAYEGISSLILLKETNRLIRETGYEVSNCDITIVCQRPKLAPYISEMRLNTANALGIPEESVNVKATTTEQLGFEGRQEGISAQAAVLLKRIQK